ncbi:MAG: helix-turn-helix domain-containing protein [Alphaproteobacteria bacterium]|nr:helix-turn-helix domain-containing protein [Alphaproteobacteria bacterium]
MTDSREAYLRGRAYGEDLRHLAVTAVLEKGMSLTAAARHFEVSRSSVTRWVERWRERGHLRADARGGDLQSWRIEAERERIFRILEQRPSLSIRALRDRLAAEGAVFGTSTVQRFLKRYGLERERRPGRRVANLRRKRAAARRG